ncbi:hypothetical protein ACNHUS_34800 [Actinomycetes bacterium M1A6_2h]
MSESADVGTAAVPDRVLDELAGVLIDRIDQLIDRLTDRAVAAPMPGSAAWESAWNERDSAIGQARALARSRVRTELVRRAGAGLGMIESAPPPVVRTRKARAVRYYVDAGQLAFF